MNYIDDRGDIKLIASMRKVILIPASSITEQNISENRDKEIAIGSGLPVSAIVANKEIPLYQPFSVLGYELKAPILEAFGSVWKPLFAEKNPSQNRIDVIWQYTTPNKQEWSWQAVSFDATSGRFMGTYKTDGSFLADSTRSGGGVPDITTVNINATNDESTLNFLKRFDYIINPSPQSQPATNEFYIDNLTGKPKVEDVLTFARPPSFGASVADRITNFNPKEKDKLQIQLSQYGADAAGTFKVAKNPKALSKALATSTDFVYLKSRGELYYNENGKQSGFGDGGIFAILEGTPNISSTNIGFI